MSRALICPNLPPGVATRRRPGGHGPESRRRASSLRAGGCMVSADGSFAGSQGMHMRDGQVPPRARQRGRQAGPSLFEWAPPSGVGAAARPRGAGGPILSTGFFRTVSRAADGLTVLADDVPVGILQLAEDAGGQDAREGDLDTVGGHRAGAYIPPGKAVTIFLIRLFIVHPPVLGGALGGVQVGALPARSGSAWSPGASPRRPSAGAMDLATALTP